MNVMQMAFIDRAVYSRGFFCLQVACLGMGGVD